MIFAINIPIVTWFFFMINTFHFSYLDDTFVFFFFRYCRISFQFRFPFEFVIKYSNLKKMAITNSTSLYIACHYILIHIRKLKKNFQPINNQNIHRKCIRTKWNSLWFFKIGYRFSLLRLIRFPMDFFWPPPLSLCVWWRLWSTIIIIFLCMII